MYLMIKVFCALFLVSFAEDKSILEGFRFSDMETDLPENDLKECKEMSEEEKEIFAAIKVKNAE